MEPFGINYMVVISLGVARIQGLFVYARLISQSRGSIPYNVIHPQAGHTPKLATPPKTRRVT